MSSSNNPTAGLVLSAPAHSLASLPIAAQLRTDRDNGLSFQESARRLAQYGPNDIADGDTISIVRILVAQVANAMTLVLILAMAVSYGIGSYIEGAVISAVILINIVVGFAQEYSAAKTMVSLRSLSAPMANVLRAGAVVVIPASEVVKGDIVVLKMGDVIPADVRIFEASNFETDEALLTGESVPVVKDEHQLFPYDTGVGDRLNIAFSSSTVTKGRARGIVYATGAFTEIGEIAAQLRAKQSQMRPVKPSRDGNKKPHRYIEAWLLSALDAVGRFLGVSTGTPLQKKLSKLAILLFVIAIICAIIVLAANKFSNSRQVVIYAVATGLSMIPASLVVVLTITMAAGTKRMVKKKVVVRNLRSLEALGAITDICSDKTGTLTVGKMVPRRAWVPGVGTFTIDELDPWLPDSGKTFWTTEKPAKTDFQEGKHIDPREYNMEPLNGTPCMHHFLNTASLANLATITRHGQQGEFKISGDPTECAIQIFAWRFGWERGTLVGPDERAKWTAISELPFDSTVKRMSVVMRQNSDKSLHLFTKGAVERVLPICAHYEPKSGELVDFADLYDTVLKNMEVLASEGLRVLALASKPLASGTIDGDDGTTQHPRTVLEEGLVFRGLIGLYDPPRPESSFAVQECHQAGIEVHMLTGDHAETAKAIAVDVGILPRNLNKFRPDMAVCTVMTAAEFDGLTDDEVDDLPMLPLVIARCAPRTKVRMIQALHRRGRFCAMTGDGVNDSPSLRQADVGIAMGKAGSDVAKAASDMVLTDDEFASIVAAIEEGRRIFDNIQKFVLHVLAENVAQAVTLLVGLAFRDSVGASVFPLSPVQIVWVIMATSGMPDMGLGFERAVADIMHRPPRSLDTGIFMGEFFVDMVVYGLWISLLCLSSFSLVVYGFGDGNLGRECNNTYSPQCDLVFRARATTFACLTWFALFLAWEMVDLRRSFFRMNPYSRQIHQFALDVWRNKFLFWAIIAGFVTLFPLLYIPKLNTVVFQHAPISWEWGVVFVATALFFTGVEAWKAAKRAYFRKREWGDGDGYAEFRTEAEIEMEAQCVDRRRIFKPYLKGGEA